MTKIFKKFFEKISNKKNIFKILLVFGLVSLFAVPISYYYKNYSGSYSCSGIFEYDPKIDRSFILNLFEKNMYWLVAENVTGFSAEYTLDTKSRSKRPEHQGNLQFYVYRTPECKPAGFVAFYKENFFKGKILFLAIDESQRRHGYARKLINFALDKLQEMGLVYVDIITRTNNIGAQNLYKSVGFHETWRDDGFVKLEKSL